MADTIVDPITPPTDPTPPIENWYDKHGLAEDEVNMVKDFKDDTGAIRGYIDTKKMVGGMFSVPKADDPEYAHKLANAKSKLGIKTKAEEFQFDIPEEFKDVATEDDRSIQTVQ